MGSSSSIEVQGQYLTEFPRLNGTRTMKITKMKDGQMKLKTKQPTNHFGMGNFEQEYVIAMDFTNIKINRTDGKITFEATGRYYREGRVERRSFSGHASDGYATRWSQNVKAYTYKLKGVVLNVKIGTPEHDFLIAELKALPSRFDKNKIRFRSEVEMARDLTVTEVDNGTTVFMSTTSEQFIETRHVCKPEEHKFTRGLGQLSERKSSAR